LDWNLDIWRCEAWNGPLGSVFDLDRIPDQREPCSAGMMACYRNASIVDARRGRGHGCGAGARSRSNKDLRWLHSLTQRHSVALGTDRGDTEDAPLGSSAEASHGQC
jgi:hypothetical protein